MTLFFYRSSSRIPYYIQLSWLLRLHLAVTVRMYLFASCFLFPLGITPPSHFPPANFHLTLNSSSITSSEKPFLSHLSPSLYFPHLLAVLKYQELICLPPRLQAPQGQGPGLIPSHSSIAQHWPGKEYAFSRGRQNKRERSGHGFTPLKVKASYSSCTWNVTLLSGSEQVLPPPRTSSDQFCPSVAGRSEAPLEFSVERAHCFFTFLSAMWIPVLSGHLIPS